MKLNRWAKEEVKKNPLFNKDFRQKNDLLDNREVLYIFLVHLGLYGWPDDEGCLISLISKIRNKEINTLREVCDHWGVEEVCVIGGSESLHTKTGLIDIEYPYDKLSEELEDYLLTLINT